VANVIGDPNAAKSPKPTSQIENSVFKLNSFAINGQASLSFLLGDPIASEDLGLLETLNRWRTAFAYSY
jgi:hypothetical protein